MHEFEANPGTIMEVLGIHIVDIQPDRVVATMPVAAATRQPMGLLHGGASVVLAETVASIGALSQVDREHYYAVGVEINANHLRAKAEGMVTAFGVPLHRGRTLMVWEIKIEDEQGRLICIARSTIAIRARQA